MATTESATSTSSELSSRQLTSLAAIVDGLLPPLDPPEENNYHPSTTSVGATELQTFWEYRLSEDPHFMQALQETIQHKLRTVKERKLLLLLLTLLSTRLGTMIVLGRVRSPFVAFCDLPSARDKTLALQKYLQQSSLPPKRRIFNAFKRLVFGLAFTYVVEQTNEGGETTSQAVVTNPFWTAMQYRGPPQQWESTETNRNEQSQRVEQAMRQLEALNKHLLQSTGDDDISSTPKATTGTPSTNGITASRNLECDFVIVGSGSGGSVAAFELAKAGYDVIVLEQGKYIPPSNLANLEVRALDELFDSHGLLTSEDGNVVIMAGATLGGGTTVNWSNCLALPTFVQEEWAVEHGLKQFKKDGEFAASMKHMMDVMTNNNKGPPIAHNAANQILQKGCNDMGYSWETSGQNLEDTTDPAAGYIGFGDRFGNKRNAMVTFLNPAVGQYKARVFEQCYVEKVLIERGASSNDSTLSGRSSRAVGVSCRMPSVSSAHKDDRVVIRSRKGVIVAAGALHSPCLLLRSGLRNRHIGRNLRLHPVTVALGVFEERVDFYLRAPQTTVCNEFEMGPSKNGYGCKIECPSAHTGLTAVAIPFTTPEQIKERMLKFPHYVPLILVQRDSGKGGRVRCNSENGRPMIDYVVNANDQQSILHGVKGVVQILAAAGAKKIATCHYKDFGWKDQAGAPSLPEYLDSISKRGMGLHDFGIFSAHQMGTCRMSVAPSQGVLDQNGETWECSDLYVMDASTFPSASGANPMMTVLSVSHMLSKRLISKLGSA